MITEFTINNGLKVFGVKSKKSPVVSVQMWVRNGSADERSGDEGLSHFIEHLVFKGSDKYKVGEIASIVESRGGELNAYTSFDQTVFYVTISKHYFSTALDVVSQMVGAPTFDEKEIDNEREVVIEEIKRSQDSLSRCASRLMFETHYKNHPYSIPVIGYADNIKTVKAERIRSFFEERYCAKNMFLLITGDYDESNLEKIVDEYFSHIKSSEPQIPERIKMPDFQKSLTVKKADFEDSVLYMTWPAVDIKSEDLAALEVLALILGQGSSSRLYKKLKLEKSLVQSIGTGCWSPIEKGIFSLSTTFKVNDLSEILINIKEVLEDFFRNGATQDELEKAVINFMSDEAYGIETVGGLARKYGSNYDLTKDINYHENFYKTLEGITLQDVYDVAIKYLSNVDYSLAATVSEKEDEVKEILKSWSFDVPTLKSSIEVKKSKNWSFKTDLNSVNEGEPEVEILSNGVTLIHNPSKTAPIFNVRGAFLSGSYVLEESQLGLTELLKRVWLTQTESLPEMGFRKRVDEMASSLYSFSGRNTMGTVIDGLSFFQKDLAELFTEGFQCRTFSEESIRREKLMLEKILSSRKDNPAQQAILKFNELIFDGHPYAKDSLGTPENWSKIGNKELSSYLDGYITPHRTSFILSGDYDRDLWSESISKLVAADTGSKSFNEKQRDLLNESKSFYIKNEKNQTHLIHGFQCADMRSDDRFAMQIIESILSGQGGRLFLELRDKASLAYTVAPIKMEGLGAGYFAAYIGCSPEKVTKARDMMNIEFEKLVTTKVLDKELDRAKMYLSGSHDIQLQKSSSIGTSLLFTQIYGMPMSDVLSYKEKIFAVTAEDVMRVAKNIFSQKSVTVCVGQEDI